MLYTRRGTRHRAGSELSRAGFSNCTRQELVLTWNILSFSIKARGTVQSKSVCQGHGEEGKREHGKRVWRRGRRGISSAVPPNRNSLFHHDTKILIITFSMPDCCCCTGVWWHKKRCFSLPIFYAPDEQSQ